MLAELIQSSEKLHNDLTRNLISSQVVPSPDETRYPLVAKYCAHVPTTSRGFISLGACG